MNGWMWDQFPMVAWWSVGLGVAFLLLVLLRKPLGGAVRLLVRTGLGTAALAVLNPLSGLLGVGLGVNLLNGAVLGLLGVPGFGLLLMLNWVF